MIREPAVKLFFLSVRRRWDPVAFRDLIPERFHEFELLIHAELTGLFEKLPVHGSSVHL